MKTIPMQRLMSHFFGSVALAFIATVGVQSHAATTLTGPVGASLYQQETVKFGSTSDRQVNIGAYQVKDSTSDQFWVYCLDPLTYLQSPSSYTTTSLSNFVSNGYGALFNTTEYQKTNIKGQYDDSNTATTTVLAKLTELYSHAYRDSLTSKDKSAAFQYAIWEIEGETSITLANPGGYSRTGGGLKITGSDTSFNNQVDVYLSALNTGSWAAAGLSAVSNFVYTVYQSSPLAGSQTVMRAEVPEPSSLVLLGVGVLALGAARRSAKKAPKLDLTRLSD